jgi:7 transmembrane sweet-taste receptor of 3 GCPR
LITGDLRNTIKFWNYGSKKFYNIWRRSLVVVAVAIFGACACLWMLIYVFIKMCDGTLNGNQTMGILLLFGIMCLFASVVPWLLPPNEMVCANRHFFHPLAMVLCFAILLVKAMQLRSLVSVGLGGTIPHVNQMVSLIFMLLVQVTMLQNLLFFTYVWSK